MSASLIEQKDERQLWRLAASRCSYYRCKEELFKREKEGILGEMAHIVAENEGGPRGHSNLTPAERNSYLNLILLCPNHHSLIDNSVDEWPVEKLHQMKEDHEAWIKRQLSKGSAWQGHMSSNDLLYINFRRLILDPGAYVDLSTWDEKFHFESVKNLSDLGIIGSAQVKGLVEKYLKQWSPPVLKLRDTHEDNVGARVKFQMTFRTKGGPGPDQLESFKLKGDIHQDPHIYSSIGDRKFYFPIDPRWITSDTAFLLFKRGRIELSGLGIIRTIEEKEVIVTPLILGSPNYEDDEI